MTPDQPRRRVAGGRVVLTAGTDDPYKAVLVYEDGHTSEHLFNTCKEGEAFLRGHASMVLPEPLRMTPPVQSGAAEDHE